MDNQPFATQKLSIADNMMAPRRYMRTAVCLPVADEAARDAFVQNLARAVTSTVTKYPFLCGRLKIDRHDPRKNHLAIDIPKDPTQFTSGILKIRSEGNLLDYDSLLLEGFPPSKFVDAIVTDPHDPLALDSGCPVFSVQAALMVNGVILSLCLHHTLADGPTFSDVIESIVVGLDPRQPMADESVSYQLHFDSFESTLRISQPEELLKLIPERIPRDTMEDILQAAKAQAGPRLPVKCRIFQYDMSRLVAIRALLINAMNNARDVGPPASTNDCIAAFIWAHIVRARITTLRKDQHPKQTRLFMPVDFRRLIKPPLGPEYFGNAIITIPVTLDVGTLLNACNAHGSYKGKIALAKAALAIRQTTDAVDEDFVRRRLDLAISLPDVRSIRLNVNAAHCIDVVFNNVAALDAGIGRGVYGTVPGKSKGLRPLVTEIPPGMTLMLPRLGEVAELAVALHEDEMAALMDLKSWTSLVTSVVE